MLYDGLRFHAECKLAGKLYGQPFGIDVAFGDPVIGEPDVVAVEDDDRDEQLPRKRPVATRKAA